MLIIDTIAIYTYYTNIYYIYKFKIKKISNGKSSLLHLRKNYEDKS